MSRNSKDNPYYEKRNHVRLPKNVVNKIEIMIGDDGIPDNVKTLENGHILRNIYDAKDAASITFGANVTADPNELTWTSTVLEDMGTVESVLTNIWSPHGNAVVPTPLEDVDGRPGIAVDSRSAPNYPRVQPAGGLEAGYAVAFAMCFTKQPGDVDVTRNPHFFGEDRNATRGGWWNPELGTLAGMTSTAIDGVVTDTVTTLSDHHTIVAGSLVYGISGFGNRCQSTGYTEADGIFNGWIHEILLYDREGAITANDAAAIHDYFVKKWFSNPITDGLVGQYGVDDFLATNDVVQQVTNQANPGVYDLTVGYNNNPNDPSRLNYDSADNSFYAASTSSAGLETVPADYAGIEAEFQSGEYTHIHMMRVNGVGISGNNGTGCGSKSANWAETDTTNNITYQQTVDMLAVRGSSGGTASEGYVGYAPTIGELTVVAAVTRGPNIGDAVEIYRDGVVTETGTRTKNYVADVGGTDDEQRSVMSIGRNRSNSNPDLKHKAALYYNRALTAEEVATVSQWLIATYS